ncbi:hypothetical protein ACFC0D_03920 [Streptomyces sp. NPDC056222]
MHLPPWAAADDHVDDFLAEEDGPPLAAVQGVRGFPPAHVTD